MIPKLKIPFEVTDGAIATVEQDSDRELVQAAFCVLATTLGQRDVLSDYGISDMTFRQGGADLEEITDAIAEWEPRVNAQVEATLADLIQEVAVGV